MEIFLTNCYHNKISIQPLGKEICTLNVPSVEDFRYSISQVLGARKPVLVAPDLYWDIVCTVYDC